MNTIDLFILPAHRISSWCDLLAMMHKMLKEEMGQVQVQVLEQLGEQQLLSYKNHRSTFKFT